MVEAERLCWQERTVQYDVATFGLRELLRAIILPGTEASVTGAEGVEGAARVPAVSSQHRQRWQCQQLAACPVHLSAGKEAVVEEGLPLEQYHRSAHAAEYVKALVGNLTKTSGISDPADRLFKAALGNNRSALQIAQRRAFFEAYRKLVAEVVAPLLGSPPGGLVYQAVPSIRCHLPGTARPLLTLHCDAEYHHPPSELNFWLPLTSTFGANTLWTESAPCRGDFRPLELEYGQLHAFYGNKCRHYTLPNTTDITRVSIDFRVLPRRVYKPVLRCASSQPACARWSLQSLHAPLVLSAAPMVNHASCSAHTTPPFSS